MSFKVPLNEIDGNYFALFKHTHCFLNSYSLSFSNQFDDRVCGVTKRHDINFSFFSKKKNYTS